MGTEAVERRAQAVFGALTLLKDCVILFDEFDPIPRKREADTKASLTVFSFLTPGMLPKLRKLNVAAKDQRIVYALATNLIGTLDEAAVREGRFDVQVGLYPPDLLSRTGRLVSQIMYNKDQAPPTAKWQDRLAEVVANTKGGPMTTLGRPGWLTHPRKKGLQPRTAMHYIIHGVDAPDRWPKPAEDRPKDLKGTGQHAEKEWQEWTWIYDWDQVLKTGSWVKLCAVLRSPPSLRDLPG